jgi:hypothetical protein
LHAEANVVRKKRREKKGCVGDAIEHRCATPARQLQAEANVVRKKREK